MLRLVVHFGTPAECRAADESNYVDDDIDYGEESSEHNFEPNYVEGGDDDTDGVTDKTDNTDRVTTQKRLTSNQVNRLEKNHQKMRQMLMSLSTTHKQPKRRRWEHR